MPDLVDLRSDTVTRPTEEMRRAMAAAPVGDDVYGEDPTINELEEETAALFGHTAAVFVPTGTMGNQIALRLLVPPARELICDADAHIVTYEDGGAAQHGGISTRTVVSPRGRLDPAVVAEQIRPAGYHAVETKAVAVEQTHNRGGGAVYPLEVLQELRSLTRGAGVALHCDGARIFNASVASGVPLATYGRLFDTMSVCLSKGLGAPVGSVVLCAADRALEAREIRHRLGGGMRQAGIIAAGGLYALRHHIERLAEDHARARRIAEALAEAAPKVCDPAAVETNLVPLDLTMAAHDGPTLAGLARADGVLISVTAPRRVRLVTHLDVDDAGLERAVGVLSRLLG